MNIGECVSSNEVSREMEGNDLNSVILEGEIVEVHAVRFVIASVRRTRKDDQKATEVLNITVSLPKEMTNLKVGQEVRVVGRIAQYEGVICIRAEHLELRA